MMRNCNEQYYQASKAAFFKDHETERQIKLSSNPTEQYNLGNKIKEFNGALWLEKAQDVMKIGLFAKFEQNTGLAEALKATGTNQIAESSPSDKYWGTGKSIYDPNAFENWEGQNNLGKLLMQTRSHILQ